MGEIQPEVVPQPPTDQVDDAVAYLKDHQNEALGSQVDLSALRRKIDRRLMPYMFCCYVLQFLDKVMLNVSLTFNPAVWTMLLMQGFTQYAAVMGIKKDLGLVGNEFSNVATWVFIAYLIAEVPNGGWFYSSPRQNFLGISPLSLNLQYTSYRKYRLPNGSAEMFSSGESRLPPLLAPEDIRACWQLEFSWEFLKRQWDHP